MTRAPRSPRILSIHPSYAYTPSCDSCSRVFSGPLVTRKAVALHTVRALRYESRSGRACAARARVSVRAQCFTALYCYFTSVATQHMCGLPPAPRTMLGSTGKYTSLITSRCTGENDTFGTSAFALPRVLVAVRFSRWRPVTIASVSQIRRIGRCLKFVAARSRRQRPRPSRSTFHRPASFLFPSSAGILSVSPATTSNYCSISSLAADVVP